MLNRIASGTLLALVPLLGWYATPETSQGCASVWRQKDADTVTIAEESAIIVWDAAKRTQHFIRWARFDTPAPDFGFLVPTPTVPKLKEVADAGFTLIEEVIRPRRVEATEWLLQPMCCVFSCSKSAWVDKAPSVRVLDSQRVGGFDVDVIEADDAKELNEWLNRYGYTSNPELIDWLAPYVKNNWKISAFKIVQDPKTGRPAQTKPVRMSFTTDRPFFPYREPEDPSRKKEEATKKEKSGSGRQVRERMLRVFLLSSERMTASLGDKGWDARVPWADVVDEKARANLVQHLDVPETSLPGKLWLTTFEDESSPRPGNADVYFSPASEQTPVRPPDVVIRHPRIIPLELVVLGVLGAVVGLLYGLRRLGRTGS